MSQGASDWYLRKPFILAVLGSSLSAGRLSGNLWWQRLMENARAVPEAVGPVVLQNFGKGSQTSVYGVATAPDIAAFNPTHILSEGFAINDSAFGISRPDHTANMLTMHNIWKAKNPAVDITWQTMNGVSTAGMPLRPALPDYYADEVVNAAAMGDRMLDNYAGAQSPPGVVGGWPKPLPDYLTDNSDGLHPIWDGALELYLWPNVIFWLRLRMAEWWGLPPPNPPNPPPVPDADFLLVAGGGGGGAAVGAGAGAGGKRRAAANLSSLYGPVMIGFGGREGVNTLSPSSRGMPGNDSSFAGATSGLLWTKGGGEGAGYAISAGLGSGGPGGSGGGSYGPAPSAPGAGIPGQGNDGGQGQNPNGMSGGGGGASAPGNGGASGLGGAGVLADWPGAPALTYVSGGGPGVSYPNPVQAYPNGGGPTNYGGGGRGGDEAGNAAYTAQPGGAGGAWVWYSGAARAIGGTVTTFGGATVHQFTRANCEPQLKLTSNATSGYVASSNTDANSDHVAFRAFNGYGANRLNTETDDNAWVSSGAPPNWLKLQVPVAKAFKAYRLQARDFALSPTVIAAQMPKDWIVEGSNNNVAWTLLDTRAAQPAWTTQENRAYTMNGPGAGTAFLYFRITVSANQGNDGSNRTAIAAFDMIPLLEPL